MLEETYHSENDCSADALLAVHDCLGSPHDGNDHLMMLLKPAGQMMDWLGVIMLKEVFARKFFV